MRPPRFDVLELCLIGGVLIAVTAIVVHHYESRNTATAVALGSQGAEELAPLARTYGPGHFSQFAEEWAIRDFFNDRRDGVFVDVGANHYRRDSTTYYLETALGWHGIAIEPQREFAADYAAHRPRTQFFALFVSDRTDDTVDLFMPAGRTVNASGTREAIDLGTGEKIETRKVSTVRLDDLLPRAGIDHIDFLSMDIELAEPKALAGFDVDRFKPSLVCIEAHPAVRQQILDYFFAHRYVVVGKYLRADAENIYFTPAHGTK